MQVRMEIKYTFEHNYLYINNGTYIQSGTYYYSHTEFKSLRVSSLLEPYLLCSKCREEFKSSAPNPHGLLSSYSLCEVK